MKGKELQDHELSYLLDMISGSFKNYFFAFVIEGKGETIGKSG